MINNSASTESEVNIDSNLPCNETNSEKNNQRIYSKSKKGNSHYNNSEKCFETYENNNKLKNNVSQNRSNTYQDGRTNNQNCRNFNQNRGNFYQSRENFYQNQKNFYESRENFNGNRENFNQSRGHLNLYRDNLNQVRGNLNQTREYYDQNRRKYNRPRQNYGQTNEIYSHIANDIHSNFNSNEQFPVDKSHPSSSKNENGNRNGFCKSYYHQKNLKGLTKEESEHNFIPYSSDTNYIKKNERNNFSHRSNYNEDTCYNFGKNKSSNIKKEVDTSHFDQREMLIYELSSNKYECMICMNIIKKEMPTWSCNKCFHVFHLHCIIKWAQSNGKNENGSEANIDWTCPACKDKNENIKTSKLFYTCFCSKQINPSFKNGTTPHSCGDVCAKQNKINIKCPHLCSLQCHPGPCPPCDASVTQQCHCGATRITARCIADESQFQCQAICGQMMNCGVHKCEKQCHIDDGHHCQIIIEQKCWCDNSTRNVLCGSEDVKLKRYACGGVCDRIKNCNNHKCESLCHEGACEECETMPEKVKNCCCGKTTLKELSQKRSSCLDPIATCNNVCCKTYINCKHKCTSVCHTGPCEPCNATSPRNCGCQSTIVTVQCTSTEVVQCRNRCKEKMLCGRHRCDKQCCNSEVHLCLMKCGRQLSCKQHRCELECGHPGLCPSCHNVSFDELFCECRSTFMLPPIACGTKPPICDRLCSRDHICEHPVRHNCHSETNCPPCTQLVNKPCPGGHSEFSNIPCFRPVATCGLPCGKPLPNCNHTCKKLCHNGPCVDNNDAYCTQSCNNPRDNCSHPCGKPCHVGPCEQVSGLCQYPVTLTCPCALRITAIPCNQSDSLKNASVLLVQTKYHVTETGEIRINCTNKCVLALSLANRFQDTYILSDNKSTDKVGLDSSLSCSVVCIPTCHNGSSNPSIATKACNSSSYRCLQRYYGAYLEEFTRYNIGFVTSVEKIFMDFYDHLRAKETDKCTHQFLSLTVEKAQFVKRFSSAFKLFLVMSKNKDDTVNVVVKADVNYYCYPVTLLSKKVEQKYIKNF